ncbi:MAG: zinc transporter [Proteobacteria bacterium]|nr:zinc transporter [Pseudomonadota bacterium]MBU1389535.1 zinc transporter [Pseudomonadota bacterium]MBU1544399.1 zinc transporter [Pseudomonadota bacterium]MBU2480673.1 zinc transporter [Pseudomonadota bacterium]
MTHHDDHSHDHFHGDHNHTHGDHDHSHGHSHNHDHSHAHPHELSFEQKLEKLFGHWIDHNDSHKETFFTWAKRADDAKLTEIAKRLDKVGKLSEEVTGLLKEALKILQS